MKPIIHEFLDHGKPIWHVTYGPRFVGAFATLAEAEAMVALLVRGSK